MYQKSFRKRVYPFARTYPLLRDAANVIGGAYRAYRQRRFNRRISFRSRNFYPYNPTSSIIRSAFQRGRPSLRRGVNPVARIVRNAFRYGRPYLSSYKRGRYGFSSFNRSLKKMRCC